MPAAAAAGGKRARRSPWPQAWKSSITLAADFRAGNPSSPEYLRARGDQPAELALYYRLGVDGLFADNADTAVAVREKTFERAPAGR